MSDVATTLASLQAIRAKLQQLHMQQPSTQPPPAPHKRKSHDSEATSLSNSFDMPFPTQHSETDPFRQNTADSFHLPDRDKTPAGSEVFHHSGFSAKRAPEGQRLNNDTLTSLSQTSVGAGTRSKANASANGTADWTNRSLSSNSLMEDKYCPNLRNEESIWKVLGTSNRAASKRKAPLVSVPSIHTGRALEVPGLFGRNTSQNTDEYKMPKPASGYTDSQMEIGSSAGNMSLTEDSIASDVPSITHPSSASKHSMRHFNSTPHIRSSAKKPSSALKISGLNLGKPMRVRVQQHPVHKLSEDKEEEESSDVISSFKFFNPFSHGQFASLASTGYHSDMSLTKENSFPSLPASGTHKNVAAASVGSGTAELNAAVKPVDSKSHGALSSYLPAMSAAAAPSPAAGVRPAVMSTPSCKGPHMQPALMQTPSGEAMDSVTVDGVQYFVLNKVGRGGSAQVYMVLDGGKNIRALKVVDLEGAGAEVVDGFRNEIRLLQQLQYCPSVIKMFNYELNEALNCLYVVLEFGETDLSGIFTRRAKQGRDLDPLSVKFFWHEMLRAVHALHKEGVIHSDLKPANFMLVAGTLKLIDFGIANALQQDKTSVLKDSRVGTPSYMSPEAIMAACENTNDDDDDDEAMHEKENFARPQYKIGVRSDVWSLGCILYNMVYGRTPFQHVKNNIAKLQAITNPAVPIKFPPLPDPHLMDVLKKCLQREVKCRPTTSELMDHPYLLNRDKERGEEVDNGSVVVEQSASVESRRLQDLLKSKLAQGSPGTTSAIKRVVDLLQKLEPNK